MSVTRRGLLHAFLLTLGLDRIVSLGGAGRPAPEAAAQLTQRPSDLESTVGPLSPPELEDLVAFAEVLVDGRALSPVERRHLVDHIETRMRLDAGYRALYRTTVDLLNRLADARFSTLDIAQRIALMTRHRLTASGVRPDENPGAFPEAARVRTRAVPDLIGGYYGSPAGWAAVGYDAFPGECGDLARYMGPGT